MSMNIYAIPGRPGEFAAAEIETRWEDCPILLDFRRPLIKRRWFGVLNEWIGPLMGVGVPIVHVAELKGGFTGSVHRNDPEFPLVLRLWKEHYKSQRTLFGSSIQAALGAFQPGSGFEKPL